MNLSTRLASVVVGSLLDFGVKDVVLAPGSRSGPLALALAEAERADKINLHVRIDERGAGFLALGLAKVSGQPVVIVTTSGSAVANLMPAVVEAQYAGVPLVALTADRPPRLRNTGSNQTIDQPGLFGRSVNHLIEFERARTADDTERVKWRRQIAQGLAASRASGETGAPGPVHINIGFDVPLLPSDEEAAQLLDLQDQLDELASDLERAAAGEVVSSPLREPINFALADIGLARVPQRGLVVIGDEPRQEFQTQAIELAASCGWPVISEPSGGGATASTFVQAAPLVLSNVEFAETHRPELVVAVGKVGLSRPVLDILSAADTHIAVDSLGKDRPDPVRSADTLVPGVPYAPSEDPVVEWTGPDARWLGEWQEAGVKAAGQVRERIEPDSASSLAVVNQTLEAVHVDDLLFVAASQSVRDVELLLTGDYSGARIIGNRGTSGIDGLVSTAYGAALVHNAAYPDAHTFAILGDLATLHDLSGFVVPTNEPKPNLTYVVIDNNGGGIFSNLEQGAPEFAQDFERVFGTPHNTDLATAIEALGVNVMVSRTLAELANQIFVTRHRGGVQVVVATGLSR